jgi:hypothetical protein
MGDDSRSWSRSPQVKYLPLWTALVSALATNYTCARPRPHEPSTKRRARIITTISYPVCNLSRGKQLFGGQGFVGFGSVVSGLGGHTLLMCRPVVDGWVLCRRGGLDGSGGTRAEFAAWDQGLACFSLCEAARCKEPFELTRSFCGGHA